MGPKPGVKNCVVLAFLLYLILVSVEVGVGSQQPKEGRGGDVPLLLKG